MNRNISKEHPIRTRTTTHLPARDDDVLAPVHNRDRAVGVPHREVARVEVAPAERPARRLRVAEVLLHHDVPAEDDLADRSAVARDVDELPLLPSRRGVRGGSGFLTLFPVIWAVRILIAFFSTFNTNTLHIIFTTTVV